jgi:hypothetical protein
MALSLFDKILYYVMVPIVAIGSILSPLTNDVRIFYGVEYLCWKYIPDFPSNINAFWEIKPIMNHIINYFLVVVTNFFIPFSNHFAQEILIKAICVGAVIFASWIFSRNVLKIKYSFLICFSSLLMCLNVNIAQAEWWGIIFAMISCALFMEVKNYWHYLAGALLILVLLVKGTTGCLIISAICIVLIFQKNIDWVRGGIGFITTGLLFYALSQLVWTTMLSDIWLAPILSHVGEYDMVAHIGVTAIATTIAMSIYIPIVGIGTIYSAIWIKNHIREREAKLLLLSFFISICVLWGQGESFAYQYFILIIPSITGLILYERDTPVQKPGKKLKRENILATSIVILFVMWVLLYMPYISFYGEQEKNMNDFFWQKSDDINNKFNFINETSILFMDTGSGPYYFHDVNSSCRYPAPLILQRANPGRLIVSNQSQYWDEYNCVINYMNNENTTYIVADGPIGPDDSWFGSDTTEKQEIIKILKNKFVSVHSGGWEIYKRVG